MEQDRFLLTLETLLSIKLLVPPFTDAVSDVASEKWPRINVSLWGPCRYSVTQSCPTLQLHGLWHARLPCPPSPRACSISCPLSRWCHPSSVLCQPSSPLSSPSPPAFHLSQHQGLFSKETALHIRCIRALASVLPRNIQGWFPLRLTGWISLQSKGLSRVFSNTTV